MTQTWRNKVTRSIALAAAIMLVTTACSLTELGGPSEWEPIDNPERLAFAVSTEPGASRTPSTSSTSAGWPADIPYPDFMDDIEQVTPEIHDDLPEEVRAAVAATLADTRPLDHVELYSDERPDEAAIEAYMSTLLHSGWSIDREARGIAILHRDGADWIWFNNAPSPDWTMATGYWIHWTQNPSGIPGWCPSGTSPMPGCRG